jgi:COP9 signalosome complex subunit 3
MIAIIIILFFIIYSFFFYSISSFSRHIKRLSLPYQELATAYSTNSCEDVQEVIEKCQEVFVRDNNIGLVKQVLSFLYKKNIQRLTNTFLTLSLSDVAARVKLPGPADAEQYILNMVYIKYL